jgi:hypothetical protein
MLISGGGSCFAEVPATGKRSTAGGIELRFSSPTNRKRPKPIRNKTQGVARLLQNASKCSETFRNALLRMTYCLGHLAMAASRRPVGNQHPFCKTMQSSA